MSVRVSESLSSVGTNGFGGANGVVESECCPSVTLVILTYLGSDKIEVDFGKEANVS